MRLKSKFQSLGNPFKSLVELLEKSAAKYKEQFMDYIFSGIKADDKLLITLSEIKELYSMRAFAATMSGLLDIFNQPTNMTDCLHQLQKDVVAVQNRFCSSINEADSLHSNARNQWSIKMYDGEEPWLLKLEGELEWPLSCVVDSELLELLRRSFEACQRLFHSYNMIVNLMQKDRLGSVSISLLVRRKRMLGQNLFESVSVIYSVLRTRFEAIIIERSALLLQCKTFTEIEQIVKDWKQQFKKLLDFEELNRGSYIHAAVDGLCYLIEKFNASEDGVGFDQSLNLTVGSTLSMDRCSSASQSSNAKKSERTIEKWIKSQSRVITVLNTAAESTRPTDSNSVAARVCIYECVATGLGFRLGYHTEVTIRLDATCTSSWKATHYQVVLHGCQIIVRLLDDGAQLREDKRAERCFRWENYRNELSQIRNSTKTCSKPEIRKVRAQLQGVIEQQGGSRVPKGSEQKKDVTSLNNYITDMHNWTAEYSAQLDRCIRNIDDELAFLENFCRSNSISLNTISAKGSPQKWLKEDDPRVEAILSKVQEAVDELSCKTDEVPKKIENFSLDRSLFHKSVSKRVGWEFTKQIDGIYQECQQYTHGQVATYIPQLAKAEPERWILSICTVDGQRHNWGDCRNVKFCLQSVAKPFSYALAIEELGADYVHRLVGQEPSGRFFNALCLDHSNKPHNPMINAGAILIASLLNSEATLSDRFDFTIKAIKKFAGGGYVSFDNATFLSERETADRNYALAYFMREHKCFPGPHVNIQETLDLYFQLCSIKTNTECLAVMAATLANGGVNPLTEQRVVCNRAVRDTLSLMLSCGMYDYSGQFAFNVGLPAKSGVAGDMIIVVPNVMGIALFSPRLDLLGNTVRGVKFAEGLINTFNFHQFDNMLFSKAEKADPRIVHKKTI
uniref:glutaminase n=1 Tax=Ditylenchus dipsaci TaxID=166011 RepID=A0A915DKE7_9BILA